MTDGISLQTVRDHILSELDDVVLRQSWGETSFFYNPGQVFEHGAYFATIKPKDGPHDRASNLNRDGLWRLNIGISRKRFKALFGAPPARPAKDRTIDGPWDFTTVNSLMPHPVYGWMSWVAVICPTGPTFEACHPLIIDAHQRAAARFQQRLKVS